MANFICIIELYYLVCNYYITQLQMSTNLLLLLLALIIRRFQAQSETLSYQILSYGQDIQIPLQEHFQFARSAQINYDKSSAEFNKTFETKNTSNQNYRQVFTQAMEFETSSHHMIRLSEQTYSTVKSLYNQPVKIFLLNNNFIMMLIYKQHCDGECEQNKVLGLNLTEKLPTQLRQKKISCSSMQTQTIEKDYAYVVCKAEQLKGAFTFFIIEVDLIHDNQGFIQGMQVTRVNYLLNKTNSCSEFSMKYFQLIRLDKNSLSNKILLFCKNATYNATNLVYYFNRLSDGIFLLTSDALKQCLTNATYISPIQNGFISVINKQVSEYYSNQTKGQSLCLKTELKNINHIFAASRTYNNIQITYFFLRNNTIIIKSSYRTNYQKFYVNCSGFSFTSYALSEHFMALSLSNLNGDTRLLVYEMQELYPRLIDDTLVQTGQKYGNFLLMSTSNYLQKGYYVFVYNNSSNQLSLKEYKGYVLTISTKLTPPSRTNSGLYKYQPRYKPFRNQKFLLGFKNNQIGPFPQNSTVYTLHIESIDEETFVNQSLIIYIVLRKYNQTGISFYPPKPLIIDSHYVNFNLSSLAVGPLQRFYIMENMSDQNIRLQFINYFNTINVSQILQTGQTNPQLFGRRGTIEKVKQIALNVELKVINPVFTLFYSTFIQNCILKYVKEKFQFSMECNPNDIIAFKSRIQYNSSKILVLTKDKWLQYTNESLELCVITGESGQCELLPISEIQINILIQRIKIVSFEFKINGSIQIELFFICNQNLYYGSFRKESSNKLFTYQSIFTISSDQVKELGYMKLTNIHFDKNYNHYLLLHLSNNEGSIVTHKALLYDHPIKSNSGKFLGHLIKKFDDQQIESIMTIDNLLMILYREQTGHTIIRQYRISELYSVYETRIYPLYGRKIVQNGTHVSDGEFLFIEAELERKQAGKSQYLVFCPSLGTTNILTHVIPKQSIITFIQQIGGSKNKYPHSIGIHGQNIFSLSIPNLIIKFDYDVKNSNVSPFGLVKFDVNQFKKKKIVGNMELKLVDYNNVMHEISYQYQFDISAQIIQYNEQQQQIIEISLNDSTKIYELQPHKITGPVMEVGLNTECPFLQKNVKFEDIFTKTQCLMNIDSKKYGILLDLMSISLSIDKQVEVIVTTQNFMCVEDKKIAKWDQLPISKMCNFVSYDKGKGIFVCDQGQGSVINLFTFNDTTCEGLVLKRNIQKPTWLIYQYFKMKFSDPFVVFQVPIRVQSNKIYFLTKYRADTNQFSDKFSSMTSQQYDNFETKDFEVFEKYAYLLEDGLGIYDLEKEQNLNNTNVEPAIWIEIEDIQKALNTTSQLVYIKPKETQSVSKNKYGDQLCQFYSKVLNLEIGTINHAYDTKICLTDDDPTKQTFFQIIPTIVYKQYKDCKNNVLSKSKIYSGLTIKLCILQMQQHKIFSNFMPITPRTSEYYMQFYSIDPEKTYLQTLYPFRMEKVSTNDTFEIKKYRGQLIVRSLFNFLCYYQLATQIKWTVSLMSNYTTSGNESERYCNATISLKNENYIKAYSITLKNTSPVLDRSYMAWIFRSFYIVLSIISLVKLRLHIKYKNRKLNKMRYNLISNQFEFQVRINSKKQVEYDAASEISDADHYSRHES